MNAPLQSAIDRYLAKLRIEKGYAPGTLDNYARSLVRLLERASALEIGDWSQLQPAQAQALLADLHRQQLAAGTLRHTASAWRGFFKFLAAEGAVQVNPAVGLRTPKLRRKLPISSKSRAMTSKPCVIAPCWSCCIRAACACRNCAVCAGVISTWPAARCA